MFLFFMFCDQWVDVTSTTGWEEVTMSSEPYKSNNMIVGELSIYR